MPVKCTFALNGQKTSILTCQGTTAVIAFSGQLSGRDNSNAADKEDVGPIPKGTYYLVDRQSGGRLGYFYDLWNAHGYGSTDHRKWFMLWNPMTGDSTKIKGVTRGHFRLHPMGPRGLSEGCITVVNPGAFDKLQSYIRSKGATLPVPGSQSKAYGTVDVQ